MNSIKRIGAKKTSEIFVVRHMFLYSRKDKTILVDKDRQGRASYFHFADSTDLMVKKTQIKVKLK